jgi:hypothetical protein
MFPYGLMIHPTPPHAPVGSTRLDDRLNAPERTAATTPTDSHLAVVAAEVARGDSMTCDRSIELQESTVRLLRNLRDPADGAGPIFRSPRSGRQRSHIRRFWRAVRKGASIPHVRFHDLRHTAASEMLRRGLLLREVQYVLGHSSPRMTERYAHFARTFKPPKSLSWPVQQSVMHESARPAPPTH